MVPAEFDQRALMRCELVPPMSTTYFDRRRCGRTLRGDASLTTAQDFDLFLRLAGRRIVCTTAVLGATRLSDKSMTRNAENYELFCSERILALDRFVATRADLQAERNAAVAGIYCWAAESLSTSKGPERGSTRSSLARPHSVPRTTGRSWFASAPATLRQHERRTRWHQRRARRELRAGRALDPSNGAAPYEPRIQPRLDTIGKRDGSPWRWQGRSEWVVVETVPAKIAKDLTQPFLDLVRMKFRDNARAELASPVARANTKERRARRLGCRDQRDRRTSAPQGVS